MKTKVRKIIQLFSVSTFYRKILFSIPRFQALARPASGDFGVEPFTFAGREEEGGERGKDAENGLVKLAPNSSAELQSKTGLGGEASHGKQMPPASVMTRLILIMVWRKLIRNPNTYSSLIGLIWALVAFRLVVFFPKSNRPVIWKF